MFYRLLFGAFVSELICWLPHMEKADMASEPRYRTAPKTARSNIKPWEKGAPSLLHFGLEQSWMAVAKGNLGSLYQIFF